MKAFILLFAILATSCAGYKARPDTLTIELPLVGGPKMVWKFDKIQKKLDKEYAAEDESIGN